MISRLRLEPDGKKLRVIVDAEDVIARMKKMWPGSESETRGIEYSDVVIDRGELLRSASALRVTEGQTMSATIFNCTCGTEGCNGLGPVEITYDGYELHWRLRPYSMDGTPLEFTFDPKQYLREVDRVAREIKPIPTKTDRTVAKRAKAKARKPARAARKAIAAKRAKAGKSRR